MTSTDKNAHSTPPARPAPPTPQHAVDPDEPQKYKRPLPQPGDKDYVAGQPVSEEEADKVEKEQADKYAAAKAAREKAAAEVKKHE